jgi:hypothetical protein
MAIHPSSLGVALSLVLPGCATTDDELAVLQEQLQEQLHAQQDEAEQALHETTARIEQIAQERRRDAEQAERRAREQEQQNERLQRQIAEARELTGRQLRQMQERLDQQLAQSRQPEPDTATVRAPIGRHVEAEHPPLQPQRGQLVATLQQELASLQRELAWVEQELEGRDDLAVVRHAIARLRERMRSIEATAQRDCSPTRRGNLRCSPSRQTVAPRKPSGEKGID